jgi:hypothetical protein
MQATVPDSDDEVGVAKGQRAGQVDGVGASQGMCACQLAGLLLDGGG